MPDMIQVDARKKLVVQVAKAVGLPEDLTCEVELVLDFSGSMETLFKTGKVQEALERLLPIGLKFDDNGTVPVTIFTDVAWKEEDLTLKTVDGYVSRNLYPKKEHKMSSTKYSKALNLISFNEPAVSKMTKFFGSFFDSPSKNTADALPYAKLVLFFTDGEPDSSDKEEIVRKIVELSEKPCFIQFIGMGGGYFTFLSALDNKRLPGQRQQTRDNVNLLEITAIHRMTDQDLYTGLLKEFPKWLRKAQADKLCR
jgi:hypothetical protein